MPLDNAGMILAQVLLKDVDIRIKIDTDQSYLDLVFCGPTYQAKVHGTITNHDSRAVKIMFKITAFKNNWLGEQVATSEQYVDTGFIQPGETYKLKTYIETYKKGDVDCKVDDLQIS